MRWPITANWRLWRMQGRAFVAPRGFAQNAAGSRDLGLAEWEKKRNNRKTKTTWRAQRQAATGWIQLWSIMCFLCWAANGEVIVWAAERDKNKNLRQRNIDGGAEATNDQWSFPFSFRLPRKQQASFLIIHLLPVSVVRTEKVASAFSSV